MINTVVEGPYGEKLTISGDNDSGFDIDFNPHGMAFVGKQFLNDIAIACEAHLNLAELQRRR